MVEWTSPPALLLTADIMRRPALAAALAETLGAALPGPGARSGSAASIGPADWLVFDDNPAALASRLEALGPVIATPAALAEFRIDAEALASGTAACPAPNGAIVTRFAQLRAIVIAEGEDFRLLVEAPLARHAALWLARPR